MEIASQVFGFLLPIIASVLTIVLSRLAVKAMDRMGVEHSKEVDAMIDKYVGIGINYAQQYAEKKLGGDVDVSGSDKKALAVKTILAELDKSGLKNVAHDLIVGRIEAALQSGDVLKKISA